MQTSESPQASLFLQDARRFALRNRGAIDDAPLQLYSSAIMFLPQPSVIRSTFENHILGSFRQLPVGNPTWDNVLLTLEGHYIGAPLPRFRFGIKTLAFSPDGRMLASGAADGAIIWCAITGVILQKVTGVHLVVKGAAFSPNCSLLALARNDGLVSIHNLEKRLPVHRFKACSAYSGHVNAVVFSADGNFLAAGASDGTITLWDRIKATRVRKFKGHSKTIFTLALSTDGRLATGSSDNTVKVWKFPSGKILRTFDQFTSSIATVGFTPYGTLLMASYDGSVKTWDLKGSTDVRTLIASDEREQGQYGLSVRPIFLSPSGKLLAMSFSTAVELRDTASGEKLAVVQGRLQTTSVLAFSPDDMMLAAANDSEDRVEIWELSQAEVSDLSSDIAKSKASRTGGRPMVFAPNGNILASAGWRTIDLWDATTGTVIRSGEFDLSIPRLTFSPNSEALAFVCAKSTKIWDLLGGNGVREIDLGYTYHQVSGLAFSPDCKILAEASRLSIRLWDIATRCAQKELPLLDDVEYIAFSSDGGLLASTLHNGMIQRWHLPAGTPLTTLTGHTEPVIQVAFSSDNKMLASASTDQTITLWDWATGTALQTFHADIHSYITVLSFHDNDTRLGTNLEVFALDSLTPGEPYKVSSLPKFGLNNNWIMRDGERVLWLPPDYRAEVVVSYGHRVALLLESGRVIFIAWDS
jgi:WD40 repeat protein